MMKVRTTLIWSKWAGKYPMSRANNLQLRFLRLLNNTMMRVIKIRNTSTQKKRKAKSKMPMKKQHQTRKCRWRRPRHMKNLNKKSLTSHFMVVMKKPMSMMTKMRKMVLMKLATTILTYLTLVLRTSLMKLSTWMTWTMMMRSVSASSLDMNSIL